MQKPTLSNVVLADVRLGSPAAQCAHFGICSIDTLSEQEWDAFCPKHIRHLKAKLSLTADNFLRCEFPLDGMRNDTRARFFSSNGFRVDAPKVLPSGITALFGLSLSVQIQPGLYPIHESEDALTVEVMTQPIAKRGAIVAI
ncbi:MAG: hypothetical protein KF734_21395 [Saprospiraceae bacterium]|nr:hypothetical protein [Saprospiraceae bacterium]